MVLKVYDAQDSDVNFDENESDLNHTQRSEFDDEDKIFY